MISRTLARAVATGVAAGLSGAVWLGSPELPTAAAGPAFAADRTILYYKDPMGKPDFSPVPKKDAMGMDYIPVYEDEETSPPTPAPRAPDASTSGQRAAAPPAKPKGRVLYYRNPMGLPDTSPVPKKDPMGMDYVPVYEGEDTPDDRGTVTISPARMQRLGVRTEKVALRELHRTIRAVGTVQADERRLSIINTKFEGWIEKLHVNATGQQLRRGQPLMEIYAPELVVAQQEYLLAQRSLHDMAGAGPDLQNSARQIAEAALRRLRNWDIPADQIRRLEQSGIPMRTLTLRSPTDGIVLEKLAVEGMKFGAGDMLYRVADLSTVWLIADVFEQDLGAVREGADAKATIVAYPGIEFAGKVTFVYPTVSRETRTAKVRVEIPNRDGRLKLDMYGNIELAAAAGTGPVVAVPDAAVLDSGTRQAVLVDKGEGRFEPREVKLGRRADGFTEISAGVATGESVVVGANFLIDAESNLRAALKAFAPPAQ